MEIVSIKAGGWFQRTFIHLNEAREFLQFKTSDLGLNQDKLNQLWEQINPTEIHYHEGALDYLRFYAQGIKVLMYEDGLISLTLEGDGVMISQDQLINFYENKLANALDYLFSKGAPAPKELANIELEHQYFITVKEATKRQIEKLFKNYDETIISDLEREDIQLFRGEKINVVNLRGGVKKLPEQIEEYIDQQIFARDFEVQLKRYLDLHREVWDLIAKIKEQGTIKGYEVKEMKSRIEGYDKVINLIDTRLDQMDSYLKTREEVVLRHQGESELYLSLHFKYASLHSTLDYVNDLWTMTKNYVESANSLFKDLQSKATESSLKNLTVVTTIGVFASLSKVLSKDGYDFTWYGLLLLLAFIFTGLASSKLLKYISANREYKVKNIKHPFE